ncbi:MAG: hypothetical protein WCY15_09930 [Phenylobacterium sp.]|uniref:hypothetical protein n=1 Tax=Phenylobacterium sp. TaxID=1871053 RepID=UPI0035684361
MSDFIDLRGASGAAYRFRRADPAALPATAGNFVYAREEDGQLVVLGCGTALSLTSAAGLQRNIAERHGEADLFIRLNVARAVRQGEHQDIVENVKPPATFDEIG